VSSFLDYTLDSFSRIVRFDERVDLSVDQNVRLVIHQTAFVASAITWLQPIPLLDYVLLTPLCAKMTLHIGQLKGFDISEKRSFEIVRELIGSIGLAFVAQQAIAGASKLVPTLFGVYLFPLFYAATWALGKTIEHYFDCRLRGETPQAERLREVYKRALVNGKLLAEKIDIEEIKAKAAELMARFKGRGDGEGAPKTEPASGDGAPKTNPPSKKSLGESLRVRPKEGLRIRIKGETKKAASVAPPAITGSETIAESTSSVGVDSEEPWTCERDPESPALVDELEGLLGRRESGALSSEAFEAERRRILSALWEL